MSDRKRELLKVLTVIIIADVIAWLLFGISMPSILFSNIVVATGFFKPKSIYVRIALSLLVALLAYLAIFVFN
jgi:hypothetical protein